MCLLRKPQGQISEKNDSEVVLTPMFSCRKDILCVFSIILPFMNLLLNSCF